MATDSRLRLGSAVGLAGVTLLAACAGAQSQSGYQEQQQAAFYAAMLQQQAEAQQSAQAQQAAQTQAVAQTQTAAAQGQQQALAAVAAQPASSPDAASRAASLPVARIDSQPITSAELRAYQNATGLARADARTDLIDVTLLKSAAAGQGLRVPPGVLTTEARTQLERGLADKLGLGWPATTPATTVHAAVRARLLEGKVIETLDLPGAP